MTKLIDLRRPHPKGPNLFSAALRLSTLLGLALVGSLWLGTMLYLHLDREKSIEASVDTTSNMARLFEENVARSLKEIDQTIQFVRHSYEIDPDAFDLPEWTTNAHLLHDLTVQIALIGPNGMLISTNVARKPAAMDLSDREHFKVHLNSTKDEIFISKPVLGRASGKWTIQLTRRMSKPDGSFGGVIVASVDPYYLSRFFEQIDLGKEGSISLISEDGTILARGGIKSSDLGRSIADAPVFAAMRNSPKGSLIADGRNTVGPRIFSFRHMKDFPLLVSVAQSESDILIGYSEKQTVFLLTTSGLTFVLLIIIGIGIRHEFRLLAARDAQFLSEQSVIEKSQELEATLQHTSQGILMLDQGRNVHVINPRARHVLGLADVKVLGKRMPVALDKILRDSDAMTGLPEPLEISLANDIVVAISSSTMPGGTLYTLTDISQHKRTEAVLADARDRAEAGARARTSFLATMSHEIRTPLNGILGITHLLADCGEDAERKSLTETMRRSAEHLQLIIEDILDVSKLEADRMTFEFVPYDISEITRTVMGIVEPVATEKKLAVSYEIAPDIPRRLMGDPGRMRQVLLNLVGNAVKFTSSGAVTVNVDSVPQTNALASRMLRIRVADTGIGMTPDDLDKVFNDFSQADGSITRRFGGTGLGLAISRKLAEKMGGDISVTSKFGNGSTFTILVPLFEAEPPRTAPAPTEASGAVPASGLNLLLAEDNPTNTLVATKLLRKLGHTVTAVPDGLEAIDALAKHHFDAVFMDVMMPRMDGLTATRSIRSSGAPYADVPIIALTAAAMTEDRDQAFAAGVDGFTTKPVSTDRLRDALAEAMKAMRAPAQSVPAD